MTRPTLDIAISPYHLTTREAPAMAALLLADRATTLMPTPEGGRAAAESIAAESPRYLQLLKAWRWAAPLWEAGVLTPDHDGATPAADAARAAEQIEADQRLAPLRTLMDRAVFEDDRVYLKAVAHDLLRGGPDPALCVPVNAGLDAFAARHALIAARPAPASVSQRAEAKLATRLAAVGVPILTQAHGERILEARDELEPELGALRAATALLADAARLTPSSEPTDPDLVHTLSDAARLYATAFDAIRLELTRNDDANDARVLWSPCTLSLVALPADALLRSSASAATAMTRTLHAAHRASRLATANLPATTTAATPLIAMFAKPLGRGSRD